MIVSNVFLKSDDKRIIGIYNTYVTDEKMFSLIENFIKLFNIKI